MKRFIPFMCALFFAVSASATTIGTNSARSAAPRASKQVYDLTIHKDYNDPWFYNDVWGFSMNNLDHTVNIALAFDLSDDGTKSPIYGKKYKKSYLVNDQSWISVYDTIQKTYTSSTISDLEFTWTKDADSLNHFSGFVKDTLGNTYNFHYDEQAFAITGDTIKIDTKTVSTFSYQEYYGCWSVNYSNDNYYVSFSLLSNKANSPVGIYNFAAFNEYGNNLTINHGYWSERIEYLDGKANITESNDSTFMQATMLGNDGNVYAISLYYADPKPLYHENIIAKNLEIDSSFIQWGSVRFAAADSTYQIDFTLSVDSTHDFYGSFAMGDGRFYTPTLKNRKENDVIQIFSGSITIAPSNNGPVITGSFLGRNDTEYTLNLSCSLPVANRKDTISIHNEGLYIYKEQNKWLIWTTNPDSSKVVSIAVPGLTIEGTYTFDDIEERNSYVCLDLNADGQPRELYRLLDANFTVTYDSVARIAHLVGTVLGKSTFEIGDVCEYHLDVTASYTRVHIDKDAQDADFIHDFSAYQIKTGYIQTNHAVYIEAMENGQLASLYFYLPEDATEFLPGEYSITTSSPKAWTIPAGSVTKGEVEPSYFSGVNKSGNPILPLWFPVEGKAIVDANKKITIEAINSYERTIRVTMSPKQQAIDHVNADQDAIKRVENGMVIIERNGVKYNILGGIIR
ncbi:MAG: hypothetical protein K6A36_06735 [Paludibacteraceae bacterium]|nr:hypothetical protein [Paludibacteraceae bacterium]